MPKLALSLILVAVASPAYAVEAPYEIGVLRLVGGGNPDLVGFSASLTSIPYFEIEGGYGCAGFDFLEPPDRTWFLRAGPRFLLLDTRREGGSGIALKASALAGARVF